MNHLYPFRLQADILDQRFQVSHSSFCVHITFQVMTVARQSTRDHDPISTFLKGLQDHQYIQPSGAG